jgi:hypothetical protein
MPQQVGKRGRGRPRKEDPAVSRSIRFTRAQEALIEQWQRAHGLRDFTAALRALVARGLGE